MDFIRKRASLKYLWSRRLYIVKLLWIHPEWLRALVALLIAAPIYMFTLIGVTGAALFVPLVLLIMMFGLGWAVLIWTLLYGYFAYLFIRWHRRSTLKRARRRPHYINHTRTKA